MLSVVPREDASWRHSIQVPAAFSRVCCKKTKSTKTIGTPHKDFAFFFFVKAKTIFGFLLACETNTNVDLLWKWSGVKQAFENRPPVFQIWLMNYLAGKPLEVKTLTNTSVTNKIQRVRVAWKTVWLPRHPIPKTLNLDRSSVKIIVSPPTAVPVSFLFTFTSSKVPLTVFKRPRKSTY